MTYKQNLIKTIEGESKKYNYGAVQRMKRAVVWRMCRLLDCEDRMLPEKEKSTYKGDQ